MSTRIVIIVDRSNSMNRGEVFAATEELLDKIKSIIDSQGKQVLETLFFFVGQNDLTSSNYPQSPWPSLPSVETTADFDPVFVELEKEISSQTTTGVIFIGDGPWLVHRKLMEEKVRLMSTKGVRFLEINVFYRNSFFNIPEVYSKHIRSNDDFLQKTIEEIIS